MQKWYYKQTPKGPQRGPVSDRDLRQLYEDEEINGRTFVKNDGKMTQWTQLRHAPNLHRELFSVELKMGPSPPQSKQVRKEGERERKRGEKVAKKIKMNLKPVSKAARKYQLGADVDVNLRGKWFPASVIGYDGLRYKVEVLPDAPPGVKKSKALKSTVLVNELRPPELPTKLRTLNHVLEAAEAPNVDFNRMRHLVRVARKYHNDLSRFPHPASEYVSCINVMGLSRPLRLWLPREDLVFDIKVQIAKRFNILPMHQALTREGIAQELDDYMPLRQAGFSGGSAVTSIRVASKRGTEQQEAQIKWNTLNEQISTRTALISRIRQMIAAKTKDETAWGQMAELIGQKNQLEAANRDAQAELNLLHTTMMSQQAQLANALKTEVQAEATYRKEYQAMKKKADRLLRTDAIPAVVALATEMHMSWERWRVAKINVALMQNSTSAKE